MDKSLANRIVKSADWETKERANKLRLEKNVFIFDKDPLKAIVYDPFEKTAYWLEETFPGNLLCSCKKGSDICPHKVAVAWSVKLNGEVLKPKDDCEKFFYLSQAFFPETRLLARFMEFSKNITNFYGFKKAIFKAYEVFENPKNTKSRFLLGQILALLEVYKSENVKLYETIFLAMTEDCRKFNRTEDHLIEILLSKVMENLKRLKDFEEFLNLVKIRLKKLHCKGTLFELLTFRVLSNITESEEEAERTLKVFENFEFQKELKLFLTRKGVLKSRLLEWDCEF